MGKSGKGKMNDRVRIINERKCQYQIPPFVGLKVWFFGVNYSGIILAILGRLVGLEIGVVG